MWVWMGGLIGVCLHDADVVEHVKGVVVKEGASRKQFTNF